MRRRCYIEPNNNFKAYLNIFLTFNDNGENSGSYLIDDIYIFFDSRQADNIKCKSNNFNCDNIKSRTPIKLTDLLTVSNSGLFTFYCTNTNSFELDMTIFVSNNGIYDQYDTSLTKDFYHTSTNDTYKNTVYQVSIENNCKFKTITVDFTN